MLELCDRYDWITFNSYGKYVQKLFEGLVSSGIVPSGKIYLFPLKSKEDRTTSKSGDTLVYMLQGFIHFLQPPFNQAGIYSIIEGLDRTSNLTFTMNKD
ncbi:MAG TPA: hypothetical protein VK588_11270, partial [Chitinophagaceae bacterium]|nr:hypothetical protein [Chitinophagaceae bacterium]